MLSFGLFLLPGLGHVLENLAWAESSQPGCDLKGPNIEATKIKQGSSFSKKQVECMLVGVEAGQPWSDDYLVFPSIFPSANTLEGVSLPLLPLPLPLWLSSEIRLGPSMGLELHLKEG